MHCLESLEDLPLPWAITLGCFAIQVWQRPLQLFTPGFDGQLSVRIPESLLQYSMWQNQTFPTTTCWVPAPPSIPWRPWSHISLDCITGLPTSEGKMVLLTIFDCLSKMVHLVPLTKLPSSAELVSIMAKEMFQLHGFPLYIISDRGPQCVSQFWGEFFSFLGINISLSPCFRSQSESERMNQI